MPWTKYTTPMLLSEAMKSDTGVYPGDGVVGRERPFWYGVATLAVETGGLDVTDLPGISGIRVPVPNGIYCVEARLIDFGGSLCLSRLRARADNVDPSLGEKRGVVPVDFGGITLSDFQALRNGLTVAEIWEMEGLSRSFMNVFCDICQLNFESKTVRFVVCKSGFGDGTYPVFALNSGTEIVGLEIEFIKDGRIL
jgi:hypothetical protein